MSKSNISKLFLEEKEKLDKLVEEKEKEKEKKINNEKKKQNQQDIMREIEVNTEKKVILALKTGNTNETLLHNILSDGAKEFKEKTGRPMTYSEMREMFG